MTGEAVECKKFSLKEKLRVIFFFSVYAAIATWLASNEGYHKRPLSEYDSLQEIIFTFEASSPIAWQTLFCT